MSLDRPNCLIFSCEHGGNDIPESFRSLFSGANAQRKRVSHLGFDPGALWMAKHLAKTFSAPLYFSQVSRLVVDLNRSIGSEQLFSPFTASLPETVREQILNEHYRPYRERLYQTVDQAVSRGSRVTHVSVHTFTPRFRGVKRRYDLGLLFDPSRKRETKICDDWLQTLGGALQVRRNEPYLGTDDGLTTHLRTQFSDDLYAGIEIEINNRFSKNGPPFQIKWGDQIATAMARLNG